MTLPFHAAISAALCGETCLAPRVAGAGKLPSVYGVTELAAASIGAAGQALARATGRGEVVVDRRLASLWFDMTLQPQGWDMPSVWDSVAGNYRAADRWIRLHTNAPHHKLAALKVLECAEDRAAVADAVAHWQAAELEVAIVAAGGCAATQYSTDEWLVRPAGKAVAAEPLIHWAEADAISPLSLPDAPADRPLSGLKVLDLTRVLAGPVASRFLAGFGATVLRIDPAHWDEPGVIPEVNPGKFSAGLDLHAPEDRKVFESLLAEADVLLHGYRLGALNGLGYDAESRRRLNPGLVDVSLNAYGHTGPWSDRRGFDSLVQMSTGIAAHGQAMADADQPVPLPVQALDHATGYLMAAAVLQGLVGRANGHAMTARLSLARTGHLLMSEPAPADQERSIMLAETDLADTLENTDWGPARRVKTPLTVGSIAPAWPMPAGFLRRHPAAWPG